LADDWQLIGQKIHNTAVAGAKHQNKILQFKLATRLLVDPIIAVAAAPTMIADKAEVACKTSSHDSCHSLVGKHHHNPLLQPPLSPLVDCYIFLFSHSLF